MRSKTPFYTTVDPEDFRACFDNKMTVEDVAEQYDATVDQVKYACEKFKIRRKQIRTKVEIDRSLLTQLWAEGYTAVECGRKLGCSSSTVLSRAKEWGLTRPDQKERVWHNPEWLYHRRVVEKKSLPAIAAEAGVTPITISRAITKYGMRPPPPQKGASVNDECAPDCHYWGKCLDWPVNRPCPLVKQKKGTES